MGHKLVITEKSIKLDEKEIGPTVQGWRYEFNPNYARATGGKTACALTLVRYIDKEVSDDIGPCTYVQTFYDIDVHIQLEGQYSHIVKPPFLGPQN